MIVLVVLIFAGTPALGWQPYGYWPSGILGVVLVVILILFLFGRL